MTTCEGLRHGAPVPGSLEITITGIEPDPVSPRDTELEATDTDGQELTVVLWQQHDVSGDWVPGSTYEVTGGRAHRYEDGPRSTIVVHSNDAFSIQRVDTPEARLLVIGDTHVGYRHRPDSDKPRWARDVSGRAVFVECLDRARAAGVDAVVHAGDIFDHRTTNGDQETVRQEIDRTVHSGIPFYYIFGNHDGEPARELLRSTAGVHLATFGPVTESPACIAGLDHTGRTFPTAGLRNSNNGRCTETILVIHESPFPVVDEAGTTLYQNDSNRADISAFIRNSAHDIDLVVTGHLHVAARARMRDGQTPVLVTGSTLPISTTGEDSHPSAWLLSVTSGGIDIDRQPLLESPGS